MSNIITEQEAYNAYLKSGYSEIMPFYSSYGEYSYLDMLQAMGIELIYFDSSEDYYDGEED